MNSAKEAVTVLLDVAEGSGRLYVDERDNTVLDTPGVGKSNRANGVEVC